MKILIFFSIFFVEFCSAQSFVLVNQDGELINQPLRVDITVPKESDTINLSLTNCRINIKIDPAYKFIRFSVHKDWCVKEYYNEFTEDQFSKLDTLVLYRSCIVRDATPLINFRKFDNWISDSLNYKWFKEYLKEINFESSGKKIEINIQTSYKNLFFRKGKILKQKKRIADAFGIPVDRLIINFTKTPYVTRDGDLFVSDQKVDKRFIRSQNTEYMREHAEKFSLVGAVVIR